MRKPREITERFHELYARRLKERRFRFLSKSPMNCVNNRRLRVKKVGKVGFCHCDEVLRRSGGGLFVCNEDETAQDCSFFRCRNTEKSVEEDFMDILRSPSRCGNEYPKLAVLVWCMQDVEKNGRWGRLRCALWKVCRSISDLLLIRWW